MPPRAWSNSKGAALHMLAAVTELELMGCKTLEFDKSNPRYHMAGSRHSEKGALGFYSAADMNYDGKGDYAERDFFKNRGQGVAFGHGLSVTCGLYGFVKNHSPGHSMHMHIDDGAWSNLGDMRGVFRTPYAARPTREPWAVQGFQTLKGLEADGILGPRTKKSLQAWAGTKADGILGPKSWHAIQLRVGAKADGVPGFETYSKLSLKIRKKAL